MAELKTKKTDQSVQAFIKKIPDEQKRKVAMVILDLMERATRAKDKMWNTDGFIYQSKNARRLSL